MAQSSLGVGDVVSGGFGDNVVVVGDLDVPELDVYRHLKDKHLKCREGLFVAEGMEVVRRLLRSEFRVHSLLVTAEKYERLRDDVEATVRVYVATVAQMEEIAGFAIHRGAVACGYRPEALTVDDAIGAAGRTDRVVVMEGICDAQNVGLIIRNAAAFGAGLVVMSGCCDPFYRRAVRVSMGNVFRIPIFDTESLADDLKVLGREAKLELVAAELSDGAVSLVAAKRPERAALVFGAEGHGLSEEVLEVCDHRVVVPMDPESDSVNVAVASGIFLYAFTK